MKLPRVCLPALALLLTVFTVSARADDGIFPPAPAAASAISFDGRGFLVHGKRTFIASGGMEYARIPHALWRDRLLRLKRAGFNCVEVYTFWNWHEPHPGIFNFTGDHDLNAFLKTAKSLDLYAIVRVGPYYCAEWDSGGYPVWLRFAPGVRVREDNPAFKAAVSRFWGRLIPIVAANQINRGGSVILVQLENEDPQGWGKEMPNGYFTFLRDTAVSLGIQVPYFFSGLHHGSDPAGNDPWSSAGRTNPWLSTEFWSVWYDHYGPHPEDADTYDRRFWKVLAYGGNGLNFYMFHGGTNFGYTNDDEDASSYDYGAAIGQAGDLRPLYYRFKSDALFAHSFQSVLEDSDNATDAYRDCATSAAIRVTARQAPAGTILFLDNNSAGAVKTQTREKDGTLFPAAGPLTVAPGQIMPIIHDFALLPGVTLERATPLLGILPQGRTTTIVAHGTAGSPVELRFSGDKTIKLTIRVGKPQTASIQVGSHVVRVLAVNDDLAERTWFVGDKVILGPEFAGDLFMQNGKMTLAAESKALTTEEALVYGPTGKPSRLVSDGPGPAVELPLRYATPKLTAWQTVPGDAEAQPHFGDQSWVAGADPLPMGADGDNSAYAWYRSAVTLPKAGAYTLRFTQGGDWASAFVNGRHSAAGPVRGGLPVTLPAGTSQLAVLTAHYGRPKLYNYLGPLSTIEAKGLSGPVRLDAGTIMEMPITTWRIKADDAPSKTTPPTDTTGAGWAGGTTGPDIFNGRSGFAWYRTTLPNIPGPQRRLHFENVDDNAAVYLNSKQIAVHQGWNVAFDAPLDAAWNTNGPNELAVLVENTGGGGGIQGAVSLETVKPGGIVAVTNWKLRGGLREPAALTSGWTLLQAPRTDGAPAFYRTTFAAAAPSAAGGLQPILRVTTTGLGRGFVWLNGHNLGRYPEKIPVNGLYLPEPWLRTGSNELVIFDEDGKSPAQVTLTLEQAASRFRAVLQEH